MTGPAITEYDDLTLRLWALTNRISVAEARREAVRTHATSIRAEHPWIIDALDSIVAARKADRVVVPFRRGGAS